MSASVALNQTREQQEVANFIASLKNDVKLVNF
jgi:hypothetical protein